VPAREAAFGAEVAAILASILGDDFVGAYFVGSLAVGGYVVGESDMDVVAVGRQPVDDMTKDAIVERLLGATPRCPARGLELTLYRLAVVSAPPREAADFEVNVNGGPRMPASVHRESSDEPGFWYVLDRAIAHRSGAAIAGPPAREVFADVPRSVLREALRSSMQWHRMNENATLYSVLNATRAWRFAAEDVLGSKLDGAAWARTRWETPALIDAAVDLRHGRPAELDEAEVDRLLEHVDRVLAASVR
jgi:hypothetical protein